MNPTLCIEIGFGLYVVQKWFKESLLSLKPTEMKVLEKQIWVHPLLVTTVSYTKYGNHRSIKINALREEKEDGKSNSQ